VEKAGDSRHESDALQFFETLAPDTPETRRIGKQEWARLLLTEEMRKARKSSGLTQQQVADKLGVTQGWVSRLEHAGHDHTLESVVAYLDAVGFDLELVVSRSADEADGPPSLGDSKESPGKRAKLSQFAEKPPRRS
jgi:transcriptional regulator with XRE-family HTH domain